MILQIVKKVENEDLSNEKKQQMIWKYMQKIKSESMQYRIYK